MVAVGHAHLRIGPVAHFARHHEGEDSRDVGLVGQRQQVVHELHVFFVRERNAGRLHGQRQLGCDIRVAGHPDAPFDLTNAVEILVDRRAIVRAKRPLQVGRLLRDRVENAAVLPRSRGPRGGAASLTEHPLEDLARIDLHRQRRRRRPPRKRIHVDAAVIAIAGADQPRMILGGELHRRQHRVLADLLRGNLVRRDSGIRVNALRWLVSDEARGYSLERACPSHGSAILST